MINLIDTIRRWQRRSSTAVKLSQLDDRLLADIGLVRGNIDGAARHMR